jgi:hypothetical protein
MLDRVTITGADDSVSPLQLKELSAEFPFVEWGILLSQGKVGTPRFPSYQWLLDLYEEMEITVMMPHLSTHICGSWSRELLDGRWPFPWRKDWVLSIFERAQINFTAKPATSTHPLTDILEKWSYDYGGPQEFIIQDNAANGSFFSSMLEICGFIVPLFDGSGGKGDLPGTWPAAEYVAFPEDGVDNSAKSPIYHGYAGGLGPDTLEAQLPRIFEAAGEARIWIDMETRVRSDNDRLFDLAKVRRCLEICAPFIGK